MVQPTLKVVLGDLSTGQDITARVNAPDANEPSARWERGTNFDGSGATPGTAVVLVTNRDYAFNPRNSGSAYAANLKVGKPLYIWAIHPDYQWTITSSNSGDERITTSAAHGLAVGDGVQISGHSGSTPSLNGDWEVASVPTSTTFTLTGVNITTGGTGGTASLRIPQFCGILERVVLRDDYFAEIHAIDAFDTLTRQLSTHSIEFATISAARAALVDVINATPDLDQNQPELEGVTWWTYYVSRLSELERLNQATGTVHWIRPGATAARTNWYAARDRTHFVIDASDETWTDTDLTKPWAEQIQQSDYTHDRMINSQDVVPKRYKHRDLAILWDGSDEVPLELVDYPGPPYWSVDATLTEPADEVTHQVTYTGSGFGTPIIASYGDLVRLELHSDSPFTAVVTELDIRGRAYRTLVDIVKHAEDATSIADFELHEADTIRDNHYVPTESAAQGLADYIVWRYAQPRWRPSLVFVNRFPTQIIRDLTDIITLTSTELSMAAARTTILRLETAVSDSGARWETTYTLDELPAADNIGIYDTDTYDNAAYG